MRTLLLTAALVVSGGFPATAQTPSFSSSSPGSAMKKITPLITVAAVEPCLPFWTEALGFQVTVTVPHEDRVGFAMLNRGDLEIMYQSRASVEADLGEAGQATGHPGLAEDMASGTTTLFIQVEALDPVVAALGDDAEVVVPRRRTFYGMDEIFVRAPCGTIVGFAAAVEDAGGEG